MFGKTIERYCANCKENIKCNVSVGFHIEGKTYYNICFCPNCKSDLTIEDKKIIEKAKKDKIAIRVTRF